jgi:Predicted endonuclease containing a URI domain
MMLCADDTLYTGVTTDPQRREQEHNSATKAARYTRARQPVSLVYSEVSESRSSACKREAELKKLSRLQKNALIAEQRS